MLQEVSKIPAADPENISVKVTSGYSNVLFIVSHLLTLHSLTYVVFYSCQVLFLKLRLFSELRLLLLHIPHFYKQFLV